MIKYFYLSTIALITIAKSFSQETIKKDNLYAINDSLKKKKGGTIKRSYHSFKAK